MLLNLQTLSLRSRDQDSDDEEEEEGEEFGAGLGDEDEGWKSDVGREIYVDGVKVGYIKALVVRREEMGARFQQLMDDASSELGMFATTIFDSYGHLRPELQGPSGRAKGTGVWGAELSSGHFCYVSSIVVESSAHRGQGVGRLALAAFIRSLTEPDFDPGFDLTDDPVEYVFCWPNAVPGLLEVQDPRAPWEIRAGASEPIEVRKARLVGSERAVEFFKRFGFRRVGRTPFFAFAVTNPEHPSRRLPPENDAPGEPIPPTNLADAFPLHHRIMHSPSLHDQPDPDLIRYIASVAPLSLIQQPDHASHTPLHIAAGSSNLLVCQALVGRSRAEMWATEVNGMNPLELVRAEKRAGRGSVGVGSEVENRRDAVEGFLGGEMAKGLGES